MFHPFESAQIHCPPPSLFTYPFHYRPHPLTIEAARQVQQMLYQYQRENNELKKGKMFGVLVVRTKDGTLGFLAAFSGHLDGNYHLSYFVPPVYDINQSNGFYKKEEHLISQLNNQIEELEKSNAYQEALKKYTQALNESRLFLDKLKEDFRVHKQQRKKIREQTSESNILARLNKQSQFEKAEYKRQEKSWRTRLEIIYNEVLSFQQKIDKLKDERKKRSNALQQYLFKKFNFLNAKGEYRNLYDIFNQTPHHIPPSGAGECAAPKLLQYAYLKHYQPLAMAEFWWGTDSYNEIRRHGHFYPACTGKCGPILAHMLQGLSVEPNPLKQKKENLPIEILYEDQWIIVLNKPNGLQSVPGKNKLDSVWMQLRKLYPQATGPLLVHRLDMDTSGIMLAAKTKEAHKKLQDLFKEHSIEKQYIALTDGCPSKDIGNINLPICTDLLNRPRQKVDWDKGKKAHTDYKILERNENNHQARIIFSPKTGRTHQIRIHAAHPNGLNTPITGDPLYGTPGKRLFLHAMAIKFRHPFTKEILSFTKEPDF